jgi:SAM-dependent methyltransferase
MRKLKERLFRVGYDYENNDRCSIALRISAKMPPVRRRSGTFMRFLEHKKNGKLLDFGCGDGGFLLEARRWGWECFGLEPDPNAGCHRLNCEGICILAGGLDSLETSGLKFDAIVLHHVIEHVIDVNDCLRRLAKTLNPGGQLVSISPNPNSLGLAAMANWWPALDAPRHAFIPSLQFLRSCCKEADLSPSLFTIHRNLPNYCMWGLKNKERAGIAVQPFTAAIGLLTIAAGALELLGAPKGEEVVLIARKSATR